MRIDVHRAARYSVRLEKVKTFRSLSGNNAKRGGGGDEEIDGKWRAVLRV